MRVGLYLPNQVEMELQSFYGTTHARHGLPFNRFLTKMLEYTMKAQTERFIDWLEEQKDATNEPADH